VIHDQFDRLGERRLGDPVADPVGQLPAHLGAAEGPAAVRDGEFPHSRPVALDLLGVEPAAPVRRERLPE
jgi:hypothetical protein